MTHVEMSPKQADTSIRVDFRNLSFTVKTGSDAKSILSSISGSARPGRMLSIMGRAGAGKTTLLDILACNVNGGSVQGDVLVNGEPRQVAQFRKMSCYVMQKDVLLPSATVRESLITSALLRLPYELPREEKLQRVDAIIAELGLQECEDVLIGDEVLGKKGISGGQRRRLSMGIEMVTNPHVVFLDEPTSGLDSDTAATVVTAIKTLARNQRTVVMTIHQPSSDIVEQFDDFMLLAAGRCCYEGPWAEAVPALASWGYPCPPYKNPADFFMSLTKDAGVCAKLPAAFDRYVKDNRHIPGQEPGFESEDISVKARPALGTTDQAGSCRSFRSPLPSSWLGGVDSGGGSLQAATPMWHQMWVLSVRFTRSWWRDPLLFASEATQYLVFGAFIGLIYLQVSDEASKGAFQRVSAIWFTLTAMSFTPAMTAMIVWERERLLLRRESATQAYSTWSFFAAKTLVTWPVEMLLTCILGVIVYFMVGFQPQAAKFFLWLATLLMFQVTSETIGTICALITTSAAYANLILSVVMILLLSFTGFLTQGTPVYFQWISRVSYFNYAYLAMIDVEFTGLQLRGPDGQMVDGPSVIPKGSTNELSLWQNVMVLFALTVFTRGVAFVLLNVAIRRRWL